MNWSKLWAWPWVRAGKKTARRVPSAARLAVDVLEDRLVPATAGDAAYQLWRQQTYTVESINPVNPNVGLTTPTPTTQSTQPQNPSFGTLIGLPSVFSNT